MSRGVEDVVFTVRVVRPWFRCSLSRTDSAASVTSIYAHTNTHMFDIQGNNENLSHIRGFKEG